MTRAWRDIAEKDQSSVTMSVHAAEVNGKYDRQLRLWGERGQKALAKAHVLLCGCDATGTETLKNMVLPGIGKFTIYDDKVTSERDLGVNFFVTESQVKECVPRAEAVCELLCELNSDVEGFWEAVSVNEMITENPSFMKGFSLVICNVNNPSCMYKVASAAWSCGVPMVCVRGCGLVGDVRLQYNEHCVVESHPDTETIDLRLSQPWEELVKYAKGFDLNALDDKTHAHVPMAVLLLCALQEWSAAEGGRGEIKIPKFEDEMTSFRNYVQSMSRNYENEINFQEAVAGAFKVRVDSSLPSEVKELIECAKNRRVSSEFDVMVLALGRFVSNEGGGELPPLTGAIPDMTSDTEMFIELQRLYRIKAERDLAAVTRHAAAVVAEVGGGEKGDMCESNLSGRVIMPSQDTLTTFCQNSRNIRRITAGPVSFNANTVIEKLAEAFDDDPFCDAPDQTPALWGAALACSDCFHMDKGRYPGDFIGNDGLKEDAAEFQSYITSLVPAGNARELLSDGKHAFEVTRFGASQIHSVSAVLGGIASQEAIKLISRQFTPAENTIVYNGIAGVVGVYCL